MVVWLIPIGLFWVLMSLYLGGMNVKISGGSGFRQAMGLIGTFVLYLLLWWGLRTILGGSDSFVGEILVPTLVSLLALPLVTRAGFWPMGVRIRRGSSS